MLLLKDDRDIFENSFSKASDVEFAGRHRFEFKIRIKVCQVPRRLKLLRTTIGYQVAEHQIDLQAKLSGGQLVFGQVDFNPEVTDVV